MVAQNYVCHYIKTSLDAFISLSYAQVAGVVREQGR